MPPPKRIPQKTQPQEPTTKKKKRVDFSYFSTIWEGNDGRVSGKRLSGIALTAFGVYIINYGVKHCLDRLDSIMALAATIFATALAFWGITAVASYFQDKSGNPPLD